MRVWQINIFDGVKSACGDGSVGVLGVGTEDRGIDRFMHFFRTQMSVLAIRVMCAPLSQVVVMTLYICLLLGCLVWNEVSG